ncbi:hypothetical protein N7476_009325 [Penicillium atrosanguineum]|uniref:STEEP1 domain-containing protein n=1 Tax=Penicillium atrosanguineum TaxID=1132637 RepID=A0A9W9PN31_9EURO|nr:hypothetical protein N7526_008527 [Penicillium atrosanguineum]KAJ5302526.1 hypothetical protein N7476_009325 [Penicillium atrosanguineum]
MTNPRLPIQTQHCRFCSHLLLSTTRSISTLPRRAGDGLDKAIILPLPTSADGDADANTDSKTKHITLLLSTTIPDRRATLIRREDGIEKRILLRCGRCRVVVGYYLDKVHWEEEAQAQAQAQAQVEGEEEKPPAVYILPGALVGTEDMGSIGVGEGEWRAWNGE